MRCFDPCNQNLKFWKSRKTPKSPFRECECHPHTLPKVGLRQGGSGEKDVPWEEDVSVRIDNGKKEGGPREKMFPNDKFFCGWIMATENVDLRK